MAGLLSTIFDDAAARVDNGLDRAEAEMDGLDARGELAEGRLEDSGGEHHSRGADHVGEDSGGASDNGGGSDSDYDLDLDVDLDPDFEVTATIEQQATWTDSDGVGHEWGNATTLTTGQTDVDSGLDLGL